jgi:hypothetical protein
MEVKFNKYNEKTNLKELTDYLESTYGNHYSGDNGNVSLLDLISKDDGAEGFYKWNAIKYLARYGKKDGYNKKDLFKAMHYIFLLMHINEGKFK